MDKIKPKKKMAMGKMMGGGMSKKPMAYKKGGKIPSVESTPKNMPHLRRARKKYKAIVQDQNRVKKMSGGMMRPKMMKGGVAEAARKIKNKK